jgi:exodeoxyribonuclease VII small subunit
MNKITYSEAQNELEEILKKIETGSVEIDELSEMVKRACLLLKLCNAKLRETEEEINKILQEYQESENRKKE